MFSSFSVLFVFSEVTAIATLSALSVSIAFSALSIFSRSAGFSAFSAFSVFIVLLTQSEADASDTNSGLVRPVLFISERRYAVRMANSSNGVHTPNTSGSFGVLRSARSIPEGQRSGLRR